MIIHQPELRKLDGHTIVYSKIELDHPPADFPEYLWYRVPDNFSQYLSLQNDAFLIPGLLAGMHLHQNIEVRGTVSPRLAYHLDEYQYLLQLRMPKAVARIDIKYAHLKALQAEPKGVGTSFSGGVDSLFTLWKHLPQNQPIAEYRISHGLFVLGFDLIYSDKEKYQFLFSRYRDALIQINVELIPLETNLTSLIIPRMKFPHFYGPVLLGSVHVLGRLFNKFFIPSSRDYWQLKTWTSSSDPSSDPLLSTDILEIIHHGAPYRRVDKIEAICDWELAQSHLRVCQSVNLGGNVINCSRCEKCVRTMIPIYALGKMEKFKTFTKSFNSNWHVLWWARKFDPSRDYIKEEFLFSRRTKPELLPWLVVAAMIGYLRYWSLKLIPNPVRHWLQRFGYFTDPLMERFAFEDLTLSEYIRSMEP